MFNKMIRKMAGCEDHVTIGQVQYVVGQLIEETVDREILRTTLRKELEPYVGPKLLDEVLAKINAIEVKTDPQRMVKWMKKVEALQDQNVI